MKLPLEGRWLGLAVVVALGFFGALLLAVRFVNLPTPPRPPEKPAPPRSGIGIASISGEAGSALWSEQSLIDPDPLFLPTSYNASQPPLPSSMRREPGAIFQSLAPKYVYAEDSAPVEFPDVVRLPDAPVQSLTYGSAQDPYDVLGRFNRTETPLPPRLAVVEIIEMKTGRLLMSVPLNPLEASAQIRTADWRPMELLAAVDTTGLLGRPLLTQGSGVEAIDAFFRQFLATDFHLGERLAPGFYTLRVGP